MTRRLPTNQPPHWHVLVRHGDAWLPAGVRMKAPERDADRAAGRKRVVRRWFTSASAARNLKDKIVTEGRDATTMQCPNPDWCRHGPPQGDV